MPALLGVVLGVSTGASLVADEAAIAANTSAISGNTASIAANTSAISGNTASIAANTSAISGNTASITALTSRLDNRDQKDSVRAASLTNLTLSGTQTIDGVACIAGDRVAALGQTSAATSGIYVVSLGAWARAADAATSAMVTSGMWFLVEEGTLNGGKAYELTTANPITLGTTALTFAHFAGALKASEVTNDSSVSGATSKNAFDTLLAADALKATILQAINDQVGTTYTLQASDVGNAVRITNAASITLTVPDTFSAAGAGQRALVSVIQGGAGQVTVVGSGTRTMGANGLTNKTRGQGAEIYLSLEGTTVCRAGGDLAVA